MQTLTKKEFEEKYGIGSTSVFDEREKEEGVFSNLKQQITNAASGGISQIQRGFEQAQTGRSPID